TVEIVDRLFQPIGGLLAELRDADVTDVGAFRMRTYRFHPDDVADDRNLDRLVGALADDGELDFGVHRAAHLIDGLVYGETLHGTVIEMRDDVVCHHAGLGRRSIVDRRDDLDQAVLHGDLDAETAELAVGLHLHVAQAVRIHITRIDRTR